MGNEESLFPIPHSSFLIPHLTIVKVGGGVVEEEASLKALLSAFTALEGPKVLVHGGGRSATALARQLGIETRMAGGRRITDADTLRVVTMVYAGWVNKQIVAQLQAMGTDALGLTGADLGLIQAHRRPPVKQSDGTVIDYGFVGDIDQTDGDRLLQLLRLGITPVIAPLTLDTHDKGGLLNTNADTVANAVAAALAKRCDTSLIFLFELPGVLADPDDPDTVIPHITAAQFPSLIESGTISGGMIPKIENALHACRQGVKSVRITNTQGLANGDGTCITLQ